MQNICRIFGGFPFIAAYVHVYRVKLSPKILSFGKINQVWKELDREPTITMSLSVCYLQLVENNVLVLISCYSHFIVAQLSSFQTQFSESTVEDIPNQTCTRLALLGLYLNFSFFLFWFNGFTSVKICLSIII